MIKATFNAKEMKEIIGFTANIASQYSVDNSNTYIKVIVGKKSKIVYASRGVYLETKINFKDTSDGEFVIEPFYLEQLPSRSAETTISISKDDEGSYKMSYTNGKSKGELVIANELDAFNKSLMDASDYPSKFVTLNKSQLYNTVSKLLYKSSDNQLDKSVGLPIKIVASGKKATIYSCDSWCALMYSLDLKEKAEKCDVLTQGSLLKIAFSMTDDEMQFASDETYTRIKSKKFDLVVPTQELQILDFDEFYARQGNKPKTSATFKMEDIVGALEDVSNVSNIANIDPKVELSSKDGKITVTNTATVGKAKSVFKAKVKSDFDISIYTFWVTNFQSNFSGEIRFDLYKAAGMLTNKDESVKCIFPIMEA